MEFKKHKYTFNELLDRCYNTIEGNREKATLPSAKSGYTGPKKTLWANFTNICETINRTPDHFIKFIENELQITATLNSEGGLTLRGRFTPNKIESIYRKYILNYVQCKSCKRLTTVIEKDGRIIFLKCTSCKS